MIRHRNINEKARHIAGWQPDTPDHRDEQYKFSFIKNLFLKDKVDLRELCPRVENQGEIGSCTANASTSAMEFLYKKESKPQPELSRMFLYYMTRVRIAGEEPATDNGAQLRNVMKALAKYGTCLENVWPYKIHEFSREPSMAAQKEAEDHQILHYYRLPNLRSIRICLSEGYPCVGGFSVPESIESEETRKSGIVKYPGPKEEFVGGHAVMFVGYDDKKERLIFQNSWGTSWGDKGYGYLPYAFVKNWLADNFWTIRAAEF